ncbi:hypothetical protein WN944_026427 [Citrus x changshan-huyou]|uniref:Uncharacterized protein n=1 Tax=Citrus x changshan-huyou TaxID=2935761 RepID=A0AAP0QHM0_9ROSI
MSGTSPEKDPSLKQKPDETQAKTTRVQATHTPKSKDESPDQNQQSQCRLSRPQQLESKCKRKRAHTGQSSEEPRITSPDAVVHKPNQSDEELQEKAGAKCQKYIEEMEKKVTLAFSSSGNIVPCTCRSFTDKVWWLEETFTHPPEYSQSQNQQNNIQAGPASANGQSQPGGSNPVQGNPPSRLWRRVSRLFCLRN